MSPPQAQRQGCQRGGGKAANLRPETLLGEHLGHALPEGVGVARLGLDADLDGLHWSQSDVGKELGAG